MHRPLGETERAPVVWEHPVALPVEQLAGGWGAIQADLGAPAGLRLEDTEGSIFKSVTLADRNHSPAAIGAGEFDLETGVVRREDEDQLRDQASDWFAGKLYAG